MIAYALACMLISALAFQEQPAATARITGRVVDGSTGAPIARAVVIVRTLSGNKSIQRLTGADGRFEVADLPAGQYGLSAAPGEFRASHVYQPGMRSIQLKPGETRELAIELARAYAISGRVVDQAGLPLSKVPIRVRVLSTGSGFHSDRQVQTDDLGVFRLFGLPSGRYIVCARPSASPKFDRVTAARPVRFVETCYPSTPDDDSAQPVSVRGSDVEGVEIRMRRMPTFTISGMVLDSSGNPAESYELGLTHIKRDGASGGNQRSQSGRFRISNVPPGEYVISAEIRQDDSPRSALLEAARLGVDVTSEDIGGLVLMTRKGVSLRGVVTFEDGPPERGKNPPLRVYPQKLDPGGISGWDSASDLQPDLTFELKNLFGAYVVNLSGLPAGFVVKSVLYRGRDIADVPTEFDGDPRNTLEIVVTRRGAELSGRVFDERGNPARGARIHLFPADAARWRGWMRDAGRSDDTGAFRIRNFPPGDYLAVAVSEQDSEDIAGAEWYRPNRYERLATIAERISLLENDRRVMDLRVTLIPQEWKR